MPVRETHLHIKSRIIAAIPLGFQQGRQCKHGPPSSVNSEYGLDDGGANGKYIRQKEKKEMTSTINTMAVVVAICRSREENERK